MKIKLSHHFRHRQHYHYHQYSTITIITINIIIIIIIMIIIMIITTITGQVAGMKEVHAKELQTVGNQQQVLCCAVQCSDST
jgi:hypothetical protein